MAAAVWAVGGFCLGAGLLAIASHLLFEPRFTPTGSDWLWMAAIGLGPLGIGNASRTGILAYSTPVLSMLCLALAGKGADRDWSMIFLACTLIAAGVAVASVGSVVLRQGPLVQKWKR